MDEPESSYRHGWSEGYESGRRELRADIRAVLDDYAGSERDHYAGQSLYRSIAARLDREPGREEPPDTVWNGHERVSLAQWRANHEDEVFERLPDEGSLPQYRLREPGREGKEVHQGKTPEEYGVDPDWRVKRRREPSVPPKHGVLCSTDFTTGECRSMHCTRCGEPTGPQGHLACFPELDRARAAHGHVVEHQPDTEEADR